MTQGLVMAQQFSIAELTRLENDESRDDGRSEPSIPAKDGGMKRLLEGLSLRSSSPPPRRTKEARASIWLDELVFGADSKFDPHPGIRQKRLSSAGSASEPLHLLQRWTDHRQQRPQINGSMDHTLWDGSNFSFGSDKETPPNSPPPEPGSLAKVQTMHISPKSTMLPPIPEIPKLKISVSSGLFLPATLESSKTDDLDLSYEQLMLMAFEEFGLKGELDLYELAIVYGGQVRVLGLAEKPYSIFDQLLKLGVQPQYVLRRTGTAGAASAKIFLERFSEEPMDGDHVN